MTDDQKCQTKYVIPAMAKLVEARENWNLKRASFYAWLVQTPEEALEPDLEIVDPHHHMWDNRNFGDANPFGIFKQLYYMTDELLDDCVGGGHNVTHTVYIQAGSFLSADVKEEVMAPLGEVQMAQGVAAQFSSGTYRNFRGVAGIVGAADLAKFGAGVEDLLLACKASPNYRGIRVVAAHDPDVKGSFHSKPGLYKEEKFREGFALLKKHNLSFDAWLFSSQLPDLYDLAKTFPETTIVLDHIATPVAVMGDQYDGAPAFAGKQGDILAQWKADMSRIASECPNVNVKVGGCGLAHLGHGFHKQDKPPSSEEVARMFQETYLWTIETFGPGRCMLESNFPVDKVCMSYTVLWNAYKRMTSGMSASDRALLFSGTAKRVYRLQ